jgi:aspartate ammonia-lyase
MLIVKKPAARIAREASLTGKSVRELILRDKVLTEDQLNKILDPYEMTIPGIAGTDLKPDRNSPFRQRTANESPFRASID